MDGHRAGVGEDEVVAQFECEIIGERIRDKIAAAKRKSKHTGGMPLLGYDIDRSNRMLVVNAEEAAIIQRIFKRSIRQNRINTSRQN